MKKIIIIVVSIVVVLGGIAGYMFINMQKQSNNENPLFWEDDISSIEDRYDVIPDVDIVFIGSSSIRKWDTLQENFPDYIVVNHGFGGSKVADSTYYYDRLITPFTPELIVIFSGINDINGVKGNSKSGQEVLNLVIEFYKKSQVENPAIPVVYISITPTKMRWDVWEDTNEANNLVEAYALTQDQFYFVDAVEQFLVNGKPNTNLFVYDNLHLNGEGYSIWASVIKETVDAILEN